jgi:microcystin-dependent protein
MAYQVKFTENTNPSKPPITVEDLSVNNETNLGFVGKNYSGYGPVIAENFLHLLENFARNTAPGTLAGEGLPVQGQLWYDNNAGVNLLKVYDGTSWNPTGSVIKSATQPTTNSLGDLWVNTTTKQMFLWGGSSWLLVGPQYAYGLITGTQSESIVDTNNISRNVVTIFSNNNRIAIISDSAFTPKASVPGFSTINRGLSLSSLTGSTGEITQLWGISEKAKALLVGTATISAENFLRSDQASTTNWPLNIRSSGGVSVGTNLSFNIGSDGSNAIFYSKGAGQGIQFTLTSSGGSPIVTLYMDASGKVGIGAGNTNPSSELDVSGTLTLSSTNGQIVSNSLTNSTSTSTGSIVTAGGAGIGKDVFVGGNINLAGKITVGNSSNIAIEPSASAIYDIGTSTSKFRSVYANNFIGNLTGSITGSVTGDVTGSAAKLSGQTRFQISGDVSTTADIIFDGQTPQTGSPSGYQIFNTTLNPSSITAKPVATNSNNQPNSIDTDQLLVYRTTGPTTGTLNRVSKSTFISSVATVPVGTIITYAGPATNLPTGYLLCDGSEILIANYTLLWQLIGYTYRPSSQLVGAATFALPDLRGRFPLGIDSMDNNLQVPDKTAPVDPVTNQITVKINAGGNRNGVGTAANQPANRVTNAIADVLGGSSGSESQAIVLGNLPDHTHNLKAGNDQFYAPAAQGQASSTGATGTTYGLSGATGQALTNSGNVNGLPISKVPLPVINPYLAINYIIFTGVLQ